MLDRPAESCEPPRGWRELQRAKSCPSSRAEAGGHQLVNRTETPYALAFSTNGEPDIVIRPDSNTLNACERLPDGGGLRTIFRMKDAVDYYDGEVPPTGT